MLRPQVKKHPSHGSARSPIIKATDNDHPLLHGKDGGYSSDNDLLRPASFTSGMSRLTLVEHSLPASSSRSPSHSSRNEIRQISTSKDLRDTEVYVHEVTRTDTLPRIILQYGIPVEVLRRANKLWANDSIQFKTILLLPVQACRIRPNLIEDLPSALLPSWEGPQSTSISIQSSINNVENLRTNPSRTSSPLPSRTPKKEKSKAAQNHLNVVRQAFVEGIGLVDVARVPSSSLSYFPPSKNLAPSSSRPSLDVTNHYRDSFDSIRNNGDDVRRSSFEVLRAGAGQIAADAYNGTQGLIRRIKDKKIANEIDLIEL